MLAAVTRHLALPRSVGMVLHFCQYVGFQFPACLLAFGSLDCLDRGCAWALDCCFNGNELSVLSVASDFSRLRHLDHLLSIELYRLYIGCQTCELNHKVAIIGINL
jgi:hypothetical protein